MNAMILAAGYGKRMRPLTDKTPKPLLLVADKPLIIYHIERLQALGVVDLVINVAHLGEQIIEFLGDGSSYGVSIQYSVESEPLETGGAINQALPLLGDAPFLLINGDVWTDYPLDKLLRSPLSEESLGRLVLVSNPRHNSGGDFALNGDLLIRPEPVGNEVKHGYTFSGISLLRPELISGYSRCRRVFPILEAFVEAIANNRLNGELYLGQWHDVGTPERLRELDKSLRTGG